MDHRLTPDLNQEEQAFLCGDQGVAEWERLPLPQLAFHLRALLASRGYHEAVLDQRPGVDRLTVAVGPLTRVREIKVNGLPHDRAAAIRMKLARVRNVLGQPMTPDLLQRVEGSLRAILREHGYACPQIEVKGDAPTSTLLAQVQTGPATVLMVVQSDEVPGLAARALKRFHPFTQGDPFDSRLLTIAERRTLESGIVFSNHFSISCDTSQAPTITQHVIAGPPRIVRVAVGANTEVGPVVRAEWETSRIGSRGSNVQASSRFSLKEQRLSMSSAFFPGPDAASRLHLTPRVSFGRADERRISYFSTELQGGLRTWFDRGGFKLTAFAGPGLRRLQRLKGAGLERSSTGSIDLELELLSHSLEIERGNPDQGLIVRLRNMNSVEHLLSDQSATALDLSAVHYLNLGDTTPPRWVLKSRVRGATLLTDSRHDSPLLVPLTYRHYLGGTQDLRGFGHNEIPQSDAGALSLVSASLEARVNLPVSSRLYLLAFMDAGLLGERGGKLDATLYGSPGGGLYWNSPFGVIQGTLARGIVRRATPTTTLTPHWQIYLSFGDPL